MAYKPHAGPVMAAPNVIPMADVMLVLLIIFMVITPMLQKGVPVDLAKVSNPSDMPNADKDDAVIVAISASDDIYLLKEKNHNFPNIKKRGGPTPHPPQRDRHN